MRPKVCRFRGREDRSGASGTTTRHSPLLACVMLATLSAVDSVLRHRHTPSYHTHGI